MRQEFLHFGLRVSRAVDSREKVPQPASRFSRFADLVCKDWFDWVLSKKIPVPTSTDRMARNAINDDWVSAHSAVFPEFTKYKPRFEFDQNG
jgi:hypothetical protein